MLQCFATDFAMAGILSVLTAAVLLTAVATASCSAAHMGSADMRPCADSIHPCC